MSLAISERPVIGITMGDAAGIGSEIVLKALSDEKVIAANRCIVIGDAAHLRKLAKFRKLPLEIRDVGSDEGASDSVEIVDLANLPSDFEIGSDQGVTGKASAENIEAAVRLWRDGKIDAICTAPISKKAISMGGYDFPGHTEFLASLTGTTVRVIFEEISVWSCFRHVSLIATALNLVKTEALTVGFY